MVLASASSLSLLQPFVSILVVYLPRFGIGKDFVRFGDFDELLLCFLVPAAGGVSKVGEIFGCGGVAGDTYGFLSGWYFLLRVRYARLRSLSEADLSTPSSWNSQMPSFWELGWRMDVLCRSLLHREQTVTGTTVPN
jgi:hypothetical protein